MLVHYTGEVTGQSGVCIIKAFSDPVPPEETAERLKPILLALANHFEERHGPYRNAVEGSEGARLRLHDWDGILAEIEQEGLRHKVLASWPLPRKTDRRLNGRIGGVQILVHIDPDRSLRAAVAATSGNSSICN